VPSDIARRDLKLLQRRLRVVQQERRLLTRVIRRLVRRPARIAIASSQTAGETRPV
jgi:hypothetical protein